MASPIGIGDAVAIAMKVYEIYVFFGKDAPEAIQLAGETAREVAALLGQYENPAALPPFLQQETGQKLANVIKGQVKRIRKTLKELKLHLVHGKAVRPNWFKWCIFLTVHVGTIKELQQELQRLKENVTINLQTATFPGDAKMIAMMEDQAQLINKLFDSLESIRQAQEHARADEKNIKRALQSIDFSKYQTNTIEPGTRKRVINELTDSGLSNQEAERMLTTCSREASRLPGPPTKPPKSTPRTTKSPVPEIKTTAPKNSKSDPKNPKSPQPGAKSSSPKPGENKTKSGDRSASPGSNQTKPKSSAGSASPKPNQSKPKFGENSVPPSLNDTKLKAAGPASRSKSPQPGAKSPSPKPTQSKPAPPPASPSPAVKSAQTESKGKTPSPAPKSPQSSNKSSSSKSVQGKLALPPPASGPSPSIKSPQTDAKAKSPSPTPKSPKVSSSVAGSVVDSVVSSSSNNSSSKTTASPKIVKLPRKPTILFVDQSNGVRASMAQLYLELVRTWSANCGEDWLFHRVDSAGLMISTRFRAEEGKLSDDEQLVPVDTPVSPETMKLFLTGDDFRSPHVHEREQIAGRVLAKKRQGLRQFFVEFDYIVCFEKKERDNLKKLLVLARQQKKTNGGGPKIVQLTGCPFEAGGDLTKYASLLRTELKAFLEHHLGWKRPAESFADSKFRTQFIQLRHVAQKDLVLGKKNAELLKLEQETGCRMRVFFASNDYGWVMAVTGKMGLLPGAKQKVMDIIGEED